MVEVFCECVVDLAGFGGDDDAEAVCVSCLFEEGVPFFHGLFFESFEFGDGFVDWVDEDDWLVGGECEAHGVELVGDADVGVDVVFDEFWSGVFAAEYLPMVECSAKVFWDGYSNAVLFEDLFDDG